MLSLWLWPEGTRSKDRNLQAFGFVHAALATARYVGLWQHLPEGQAEVIPAHIEVLDAIPEDWTIDSIDDHVEMVRDVFVTKLANGPPAA